MTLTKLTLQPILLAAASALLAAVQPGPGPEMVRMPSRAPTVFAAADRSAVVASLSTALRDQYVFPAVGEKAAAKISAALAAGAYDRLTTGGALAARLTTDLTTIAHDKHLRVMGDEGPMMPPSGGGAMPRGEAGIVRADRLGGGVGYIEIGGFPPPLAFRPALDRAMAALAGSRVLIIDARRNHGGAPGAVAYLVSYLVPPGVPINDIVSRVEKTSNLTRRNFRSEPTPVSFADVPVYVLTSSTTFSGGE
jgi:hypothetical protein